MNILITGESGFLGRTLTAHLRRRYPDANLVSIGGDMKEPEHVKRALRELAGPVDWVFHLAGSARVSHEIGMAEYFANNFLTTANLIEALEIRSHPVSVFFSSTVHVYGNQTELVDENSEILPVSAYGFTKYLAEEALRQATLRSAHFRVVIGRLYSCIGPGQSTGFVVSDLAHRLANLAPGQPLKTGPLTGIRRFLDARDAVAIFPALLEKKLKSPFEVFNIASPHELDIESLVERLLKVSGRATRLETSADSTPNAFQGLSVRVEKLIAALGSPAFRPLEQTLRDIWADALRSKG